MTASEPTVAQRLFVSSDTLRMLNADAVALGFNRTIPLQRLLLPVGGRHEVVPLMTHRHRGGTPCEPHVRFRAEIETVGGSGHVATYLDVDLDSYFLVLGMTEGFEVPDA